MKIMPVQETNHCGQRAPVSRLSLPLVTVPDTSDSGIKCAKKELAAIRDYVILAKISLVPVRPEDS
jgi:hypothetical protein